jgi:hypothetical protein
MDFIAKNDSHYNGASCSCLTIFWERAEAMADHIPIAVFVCFS